MPRSRYRGYTIVTQQALTEDGSAFRWRYKIYKPQPRTDLPSDFDYDTAQEAESSAQRHIDTHLTQLSQLIPHEDELCSAN